MVRVRVPVLKDIPNAIRIYYAKHELTTSDIRELFGVCAVTAKKLKDMARVLMSEREVPSWNELAVNTACAFDAWGLNINDLEHRYKKLVKYGMVQNEHDNRVAQKEIPVLDVHTQADALPHVV